MEAEPEASMQPGPATVVKRLMIREMVLENFKSYAGAQHVGPFHKSFSAVVGPNGSGKSNVIDAMLFVFGRRAKQLRFNKLSELIHNSQNHRNCESAKVTVHFQEIIDRDDGGFDEVPGSRFSVTRTANRSNTSDYYVNDRKVKADEVAAKLKGKGIDLDNNRFLILQGEVEQISMMKPKAENKNDTGLLEYLEDIIGTDAYVPKIEESSKRLEELNEKRQAMIQRLKVAEKEKDGLETKKDEAEDFLDKQAAMLRHRMSAAQINFLQIQAALEENERMRGELEAKLKHEREKHAAYDQDNKGRDKKFHAVEKQYQVLSKALEAAQEKFKEFERRDAQLQMEIKHAKQKLKKTGAKMDTDAVSTKKLESEVSTLESELPRTQAAIQQLTAELAQQEGMLESMLEAIKGEVEGYHQQLSEVRAELAPWEKRMGEVSSRLGVSGTERDMLAKRSEDAKRRLDAALKGLAAAQQSAGAKGRQIQELEAAAGRCRQQIEQHRSELQAHRAEQATLEATAHEARERAASLRADTNAVVQQSGLVTALMAAKAKGEVSGVYGRLGDLGAIDKQYDVAVSTAVGALDFIVVDTASDAQKCVEFLRRSQLGVATFLILEKQRHLAAAAAQNVQTPEGAPRLYDLLRLKDESLRPAFYFAMGNTLVASDLDQATRIAYGGDSRFKRVVTLQGQLIAESGTMSGGGGRAARGRMQLGAAPRGGAGAGGPADAKAAAAELKAAEQQLEAATHALKSARDQLAACEQALKAAEKQLSDLETAVPKARMEAEAEAAKAQDIQQRLDELRAATELSADDVRRISELESEMRREEAALAQLRAQTAGLEAKAAAVQAKIDSAGGEKLKKQKAVTAKLQKDIGEAEAEATRKVVQAKANAKTLDKLRKEAVKDGAEKSKLEEEIRQLEAGLKSMEEEALGAMEAVRSKEAELEGRKAEMEAARAERDKSQSEFAAIQRVQLAIETQLEELARIRKDESKRKGALATEVENFLARLAKVTGTAEAVPTAEQLQGQTIDDHVYKAGMLESEMQKMAPDMDSIEQFRQKEADYNTRAKDLEEATKERDEVRRTYEDLRKKRLDEFMSAFNLISLKLKEMYQMITLGGDAELELVDSLDPFSEGIVFSVRPPRKSWKNISNLSGGEKTLSSLSLVFALHHYKPTPLYVMDEIDAALDFKNVSIVGHYIKDRTKDAQFIIISLRNNMFELADRLVGIYKTDNATQTVTINPAEFTLAAAAAAEADREGAAAQAAATARATAAQPATVEVA